MERSFSRQYFPLTIFMLWHTWLQGAPALEARLSADVHHSIFSSSRGPAEEGGMGSTCQCWTAHTEPAQPTHTTASRAHAEENTQGTSISTTCAPHTLALLPQSLSSSPHGILCLFLPVFSSVANLSVLWVTFHHSGPCEWQIMFSPGEGQGCSWGEKVQVWSEK